MSDADESAVPRMYDMRVYTDEGGIIERIGVDYFGGLTKRELFAAMAMQGYIKNPQGYVEASMVAKEAINYADALLKELEKKE